MTILKANNTRSNRGAAAEKLTQDFLRKWQDASPYREANRLTDTKAAGRTIKSSAADFEFFCWDDCQRHGLIEVKQTEHAYRLAKSKVTQLGRLRKRFKCGGLVFVLVYHSTLKKWRCLSAFDLFDENNHTASWDMRHLPVYDTPGDALNATSLNAVFLLESRGDALQQSTESEEAV